jgi:hypothetical protein
MKHKKHPKFLIAQNPMVNPDDVYIFHSQKPRFLAKVEVDSFIIEDDIDNIFEYCNGDEKKVNGLINRMSDWYKAYKIHEQGQIHREN